MGAVLTIATFALTACTSGPWGQGGPGGSSSPGPTAVSDTAPDPEATESPDPSPGTVVVDEDEAAPEDPAEDALGPVATVGEGTLVWEPTPSSRRLFTYDLTECMLDGPTIVVAGVGAEDDTGAASTLTMDVSAAELLHARTGTYHGSGHVTFTADGSEVTSDGRVYSTPEGYTGPSMFDYRVTDTTVELKALWWIGDAQTGAGAVDITCHA